MNPDAHEPLVDRATWEAAQVAQPKPARGIHGEALLGGLVRCAGCSRRVSSTFRNGRRYYSCRRYHAGGDCPEPASISAPLIEPYVTEALFTHARELSYSSSERTAAIEQAEKRLEETEAELSLYQETIRLSEVGATHFEAGMRSRVAEVEEARRALAGQRLAAPQRPTRNPGRPLAEAHCHRAPPGSAQRLLGDLDSPWPVASRRARAADR